MESMALSPELAGLLHALRAPERRRERTLTGAAVAGDLDQLRAFLEGGADLEERSIGFASPLQAAAGAGRAEVVELLLERGADPRQKPEAVYSPLSAAAMHGHAAIVRRLLEAIGDLAGEERALAHAASHGQLECLNLLVEHGAPLGEHAGHVLRMAAYQGHLGVVRRLLELGVDPLSHPDYARDLLGQEAEAPYLPRQAALDNGQLAVVCVLDGLPLPESLEREHERRRSKEPSLAELARALGRDKRKESEPPPLAGEARAAALARVLAILGDSDPADLSSAGPDGRPWLVAAAATGHGEIVRALLGKGLDPNAADGEGRTALFTAAEAGDARLVAALIEAGADPGRAAADRRTPLMAAAASGEFECVERLLAAGADPRARVRGRSAVGYAEGPRKAAIRARLETALAQAKGRAS
jgi:ankyrin repeat protein